MARPGVKYHIGFPVIARSVRNAVVLTACETYTNLVHQSLGHGNVRLLLLRLHQSHGVHHLVRHSILLRREHPLGDAPLHLR